MTARRMDRRRALKWLGGTAAGLSLLPHLSDRLLQSDEFNVPIFTQPDRRNVAFEDRGWRLEPAAPRFRGRFVFMTDERAISYAESIMGIVEAYRLGEIVGALASARIGFLAFAEEHFEVPGPGRREAGARGPPHHSRVRPGAQPDQKIRMASGIVAGSVQ